MRMLSLVLVSAFFAVSACAQQATIDLKIYKNNKRYSYAEKAYPVGKHVYTLVNIKPAAGSDTTCISAIVIDKRKLLFCDLGAAGRPVGLMVPKNQPIADGLVVIKASPVDGKTFAFLPNGKLLTLPGALAIIDTMGKTILTVWENDGQYRLTVLDYGAMRIVIPTTIIARPDQWYTTDVQYSFTVAGEKGAYTVDTFTKGITKAEKLDASAKPVEYVFDPDKTDVKKCCDRPDL